MALACSSKEEAAPAKKEAPAHVEAPKPEGELTTVKLSQDAVKRLGIETVVVKIDTVAMTRALGGEVTVPEGRAVTVTAPVAGTVSVAPGMQPGARVTRGARLMTLTPLASSDRDQSIEARRAVDAAQADAEASRLRLQRLEQLLKDGAASVRSVEEARAQLQVNDAALNAARERLNAINQGPMGPRGEIAITAPLDGVIQGDLGGSRTNRCRIGRAAPDRAGQHAVDARPGVCWRRQPDRRGPARGREQARRRRGADDGQTCDGAAAGGSHCRVRRSVLRALRYGARPSGPANG